MEKTKTQAEKLNKQIGNISSILGPLLFFPSSFEWEWWPIPPFIGVISGAAFYILWIQTERKDFGLVNRGCLFQFAVGLLIAIALVYVLI